MGNLWIRWSWYELLNYEAVGACSGKAVNCTLLSDYTLGDKVFEKSIGDCEELSFGY